MDGWDGSGKTTIAKELAGRLGLIRYELDDYLHKHSGGFLEHLQYTKLEKNLAEAINNASPILVEGICVLAVLNKVAIMSDVKIYVRRIQKSGIWYEGLKKLDTSKTADEVIEEDKESARRWAELCEDKPSEGTERLDYEIIRYHYQYLPHETADLYFNRIEKLA